MIRLLTEPFCVQVPDTIEEYLEHGVARCIAFNGRGTLLAAGCANGDVVLWDFETRGVARVLRGGHTGDVAAVAWSRDGRRLASAGADSQLRMWDVLAGATVASATLAGKPVSVQLHPRAPHLALACCQGEAAALLDTRSSALTPLPFGTHDGAAAAAGAPAGGRKAGAAGGGGAGGGGGALTSTGVAVFSRRGDAVFVGSSQGTLAAVGADDAAVRECVRLGSGAAVRSLCVSRCGRVLLALCADRVLRAVDAAAPGLRPLREFRDAVNRASWRAAALSPGGEHVVAAAGGSGEHLLHVWARDSGALAAVLEGPPDAGAAAAVAWHPGGAPLLASLAGGSGRVYVWARTATENWSAFAPDFRELEENEEYVEREDEFDAPLAPAAAAADSAAAAAAPGNGAAGSDEPVDVLTPDPALGGASDSDEPPDVLHHLPLLIEPPAADAAPEGDAAPAGDDAVHGGDDGQPAAKKART